MTEGSDGRIPRRQGPLHETRRLPVLHVLASFAVALGAGLALGLSLDLASSERSPERPSDTRGADDDPSSRLSRHEAVGQLVLRPMLISPVEPAKFDATAQLVRRGSVGGVVLLLGDEHAHASSAAAIASEVDKLTAAASEAGLPPPLIVVAAEGITRRTRYCADIPKIQLALRRALRPAGARRAGRQLGRAVGELHANALLAVSFKDDGPCGGKVRGGRTVDPRAFVAGLRDTHVALIARGGRRPGASVKTERYQRAGAALRIVSAALSPRRCPTWRDARAVSALRGALTKDALIATPDLSDAPGPTRKGCPNGGDRRSVRVALAAGADLAISSSWVGGGLRRAIEAYYRANPARLVASCNRMRLFKQAAFGLERDSRTCPSTQT